MMTVREFTGRLWYAQEIVVIRWKDFDEGNNLDKALMTGANWKLRSAIYADINNMIVDSYGVKDNKLIIEVH